MAPYGLEWNASFLRALRSHPFFAADNIIEALRTAMKPTGSGLSPDSEQVRTEFERTRPDFVVFIPQSLDGSSGDTGNEHFLVFDGPDGRLMAVWTQSTYEARPDQRITFSRSRDEGITWDAPVVIAGPTPNLERPMCSWGFPLVSKSGRIYVLYGRHMGVNDIEGCNALSARMAGIYSDDNGDTWSGEGFVPMARSKWDNPDSNVPPNWIIWQAPRRLVGDKYLVGLTRHVSTSVRPPAPVAHWTALESVSEFLRFENIDQDPSLEKIEITWLAQNDASLRMGFPGFPEVSALQEPSVVRLPDDRLFAVMRSPRGNPYYSVSVNGGDDWSRPEVLLANDSGPALLHPCSPCPIYPLDPGKFLFLFHNHDGNFEGFGPFDSNDHRRPIYGVLGEFRPSAIQPIWFSEPRLLMDNQGVKIGFGDGRSDLAMYASFTCRQGQRVLWYPDRKVFLLGKRIDDSWLNLPVPLPAAIPE